MIRREQYIRTFRELLDGQEISVLNIYGERGIGKTAIGIQLREDEELKKRMYCGFLDCSQFSGMAGSMMVEVLYELCGVFASMRMPAPLRFHIADSIDSRRYKRASFLAQQKLPGIGLAMEVQDFVDSFVEIPYVSAGLKTAQLMSGLYRRYKPKNGLEKELFARYSSLGDMELHEMLPGILAEDMANPIRQSAPDKRAAVFLENCDSLPAGEGKLPEWLVTLIGQTPDIFWVLFSRKRLEGIGRAFPVCPMEREEGEAYLLRELSVRNESLRKRILEKSAGRPFYMQRITAFIGQKEELSEQEWKDMELRMSSEGSLAREILAGLSENRREILIQLIFARSFDEDLFKRLFPGKLFGLYKEWFDGPLFTGDPSGCYYVQHSICEELQAYIGAQNPVLSQTCLENLFTAEGQWLQYYAGASRLIESRRHLECLCGYGRQLSDAERCFRQLISLKESIFLIGGMVAYCGLLELLADRLTVSRSRLQAYKELAAIDFCCGRYENAWKSAGVGIALAKKDRDIKGELQFLCIRMNLSHISSVTVSGTEGAVETEIRLAENYLERTERAGLSYKEKAACAVTAQLFLARAYIARGEGGQAQKCLDEIFALCGNPSRRNALALYGGYAEAMELQGVLYSEGGEKRKALEAYLDAVEAYQMGEIFLEQWDAEFYLNFGLAYKRVAERYFSFGEYEEGIQALELALLQYQNVRERMPDMLDTFCKIGFACTEGAARLWEHREWDHVTEKYLSQAKQIVEEAVEVMEAATGRKTPGNRQLCNIRCTASRLSGLFYGRKGEKNRAERFFLKSIEDGDTAIQAAREHPYGYMEYAKSCLEYARFTGEKTVRTEYAEKGAEAIRKARTFMGNPEAFSELLESLNEFL